MAARKSFRRGKAPRPKPENWNWRGREWKPRIEPPLKSPISQSPILTRQMGSLASRNLFLAASSWEAKSGPWERGSSRSEGRAWSRSARRGCCSSGERWSNQVLISRKALCSVSVASIPSLHGLGCFYERFFLDEIVDKEKHSHGHDAAGGAHDRHPERSLLVGVGEVPHHQAPADHAQVDPWTGNGIFAAPHFGQAVATGEHASRSFSTHLTSGAALLL